MHVYLGNGLNGLLNACWYPLKWMRLLRDSGLNKLTDNVYAVAIDCTGLQCAKEHATGLKHILS